VKLGATRFAGKALGGLKSSALFAAKPATNPVIGRVEMMKDRLKPRFEKFSKGYAQMGLPPNIKDKRNKEKI
jgi:hypothetical protein